MPTLEIYLTNHAVDRFHERVRPALTRAAAEDELARLVVLAAVVPDPPAWFAGGPRQAAGYLVVGDLLLPLVPRGTDDAAFHAVTCIARGGISDAARARRNSRRRRRTAGRIPRSPHRVPRPA